MTTTSTPADSMPSGGVSFKKQKQGLLKKRLASDMEEENGGDILTQLEKERERTQGDRIGGGFAETGLGTREQKQRQLDQER